MNGWRLVAAVCVALLVGGGFYLIADFFKGWRIRRTTSPTGWPSWIWAPDDEQPGHWRKAEPGDNLGTFSIPVVVAQGSENDGVYRVPFNGGTYQIDGIADGIEIHTGPLSPDANWWELDQQRPPGSGDSQTP